MSELRGALGAVFYGAAGIYTKSLAFVTGDNVTNSEGLIVTSGFSGGQKISVYGSTSNDGNYEIDSVSATKITITAASFTAETPASSVFIYTSSPGTQLAGFFNWSINKSMTVLEATDFADAGTKTYIAGDKVWTATASMHWMDDDLTAASYFGEPMMVRFFTKYSAAPSAPAPVYLYEGLAVVTGLTTEVNVGAIVEQPLTFTGVSPLVYRALTAYP